MRISESGNKRQAAGGIVFNPYGQVVLIYMEDVNVWDFPKGGIKDGESAIDAAVREIYEETGIIGATYIKDLSDYVRPAANGKPVIIETRMFLFFSDQSQLTPVMDDVKEVRWFDLGDVYSKLSLDGGKEYFLKIKQIISDEYEKYQEKKRT